IIPRLHSCAVIPESPKPVFRSSESAPPRNLHLLISTSLRRLSDKAVPDCSAVTNCRNELSKVTPTTVNDLRLVAPSISSIGLLAATLGVPSPLMTDPGSPMILQSFTGLNRTLGPIQ